AGRGGERRSDLAGEVERPLVRRWARPARARGGALAVVVVHVLPQDALELAPAEDKPPVQAVITHRADEALGVGVGVRSLHRRPDNLDPSVRKTSSKAALNFASRSWSRNRAGPFRHRYVLGLGRPR